MTHELATLYSLLLAAIVLAAAAPAARAATVLECGGLIDVEAGVRHPDVRIVVEQGRIAAVGPGVAAPAGAETIDLSGSSCLPGLIDLHAHLVIPLDRTVPRSFLERSNAEKTLLALRNAQKMLGLGFTTLRVPGDLELGFANVALRDAFARGDFLGPRMLVAPVLVGPTGGHGDMTEIAPDVADLEGPVVAAGADSMREEVRRQLAAGADWIEVMATGGVMSAHDDPEVQAFTDEELRALADETHRHDKKITAHAHGNAGIVAAARAGFDSIEHGTLIEDSGIEAMLEAGAVLVPAAYVVDRIVERGATGGITEENHEKAVELRARRDQSLLAAYRAGVPIGFGTGQIFPHEESPREFAALVRVGIEPVDALRAATMVAARLLGLEDEIGVIALGRRADVIAVPGDPLEEIEVMERVHFVMMDGRVVKSAALH